MRRDFSPRNGEACSRFSLLDVSLPSLGTGRADRILFPWSLVNKPSSIPTSRLQGLHKDMRDVWSRAFFFSCCPMTGEQDDRTLSGPPVRDVRVPPSASWFVKMVPLSEGGPPSPPPPPPPPNPQGINRKGEPKSGLCPAGMFSRCPWERAGPTGFYFVGLLVTNLGEPLRVSFLFFLLSRGRGQDNRTLSRLAWPQPSQPPPPPPPPPPTHRGLTGRVSLKVACVLLGMFSRCPWERAGPTGLYFVGLLVTNLGEPLRVSFLFFLLSRGRGQDNRTLSRLAWPQPSQPLTEHLGLRGWA